MLYHRAILGILNAEFCKYGPWKSPEKDYMDLEKWLKNDKKDLENLEFDHKKVADTLCKVIHFWKA